MRKGRRPRVEEDTANCIFSTVSANTVIGSNERNVKVGIPMSVGCVNYEGVGDERAQGRVGKERRDAEGLLKLLVVAMAENPGDYIAS